MEKSTFKEIITTLQCTMNKSRELYKLGVDIMEIEDPYLKVIDSLMREAFNEEQLSWIDWYLYERESLVRAGKFNKAYKKVGRKRVEICHNIDSLFETIHEAGHPKKIDPNKI